jgi:putative ABC transport system substrate-binding protein
MKRRELIMFLGGATVAWPLAASAQQKAMPVVGYLGSGSAESTAPFLVSFRQGLSDARYVEGRNLAIEFRGAEGHLDRLPALAADLVERKVDVIFAGGPAAQAARNATSTIPIVFIVGVDPVATGLVASLARPGGNLTGFTIFGPRLTAKRLELLTELVPQARIIAMLVDPTNPNNSGLLVDPTNPNNSGFTVKSLRADTQEVARAKGVQLELVGGSNASEIDAAFATLVKLQAGGLLVNPEPIYLRQKEQIVALAARNAMPTIYVFREFADAGGLISYGQSAAENVPRAAGVYAGRILNGEKPADLPVQQPAKIELVINLKTAKALDLTVPQSLLASADEVIE